MKFIKLYESFEDIDSICEKYDIDNYTINSDGTVDVDDNVNLTSKKLTKLPLKFGNVTGYFNCGYNNLISLEGCPQSVSGTFNCSYNKLTTLKDCPQSVSGTFNCSYNKLTSLEFCPQSVANFDCISNMLKTLEFCPQSVGGYLDCQHNQLTTLEFFPKSTGGYFDFGYNQIKDMYGFPEFFYSEIYYNDNPVEEILELFETKFDNRLGKVIDLLNEYGVIQKDGKLVILDRLEEVFHTLNMKVPEIDLEDYKVF